MKTIAIISGIAAAAALTATLAACSTAPAPTETQKPVITASAPASPAPTNTAAALPDVKSGQEVDTATTKTINDAKSDKVVVYTTTDGKNIVVTKDAPVPTAVVKDITKATAPVAAPATKPNLTIDTAEKAYNSIYVLIQKKSTELGGRPVIAVFESSSSVGMVWATLDSFGNGGSTGIIAGGKAATVTAAQKWAKANDGVVIVVS